MEKLSLCRMCLVEGVCMYKVSNKNLQELYEKHTNVPFVTEDSRPMLACFICCRKLKKCYQFLRQCLQAEDLFAQMMDEDNKTLTNRGKLAVCNRFKKTPVLIMSLGNVGVPESITVKEEPPAGEGRYDIIESMQEYLSDDSEPKHLENSHIKEENIAPQQSESDSEEDAPIMEFKIELGDEQEASVELRRASESERRDDEASASNSIGSRGRRGKNAQYYRDYRARKRAEQEKESLNRTSDRSTTHTHSSTINDAGSVESKKRKSAAEYQKEYRARKKAKRNIHIDSLAVIPSISTE